MFNGLKYRQLFVPAVLAMGLVLLSAVAVMALEKEPAHVYGVAIKGYDAVAYFTENRAVKGNSNYSYNWNDATWLFSKTEHRDLFAATPEKYAPKHGGF